MKFLTFSTATALFLSALSAHATLEEKEAVIGSITKLLLRAPHGGEGEATQSAPIEIPEGFYAVKPMPKLTLVAGNGGHGAQEMFTLGDLQISGAFSRETLPNQPAGGGFMTLTNRGMQDDVLIAARSSVSARVEIHEMKMDGDVMRMRELAGGLPIPAGETVTLKPGGYHLMFMGLNQPFVEGEMIEVTLTFEKAGDVAVKLKVGPRNASAHKGHMGHGN